jgi:actin-binding LIM protein
MTTANTNAETSSTEKMMNTRPTIPRSKYEIDNVDFKNSISFKRFDSYLKSEAELSKIATGIGKVFLHNLKEREKFRQWKTSHLDPRNASRTPSANKVKYIFFQF